MSKPAVAVLGAGNWGTTLALVAARAGNPVLLWTRREDRARQLRADRENRQYLPGYPFPASITVTADPAEATESASLVLFVVPTRAMRETADRIAPFLPNGCIAVSAAKGFERGTLKRMSVVLSEATAHRNTRVAVLSGPNVAGEIAAGKLAATVIASEDAAAAEDARRVLLSPTFRIYAQRDVVGVELGGALKNAIALAIGICNTLDFGENAKAALITRGLAEMTRLGEAMGADPLTFSGLAGLGDLLASTSSPMGRNVRAGGLLATGKTPAAIVEQLGQVVEGFATVAAAHELARAHNVQMPICHGLWEILVQGKPVEAAITELLERHPGLETTSETESSR